MIDPECLAVVRELISEHHEPVADDAPLELESLSVVLLVEAIEDHFAVRFHARDVVPEHFASIAALAAFVTDKRREDLPSR